MNIDDRIENLNKDIIRTSRKIKNIQVFDDIIGITSGVSLIIGINIIGYISIPNNYYYLHMPVFQLSILVGILPSINLPTYKTMKKVTLYQEKIRKDIDELHEIALEENKKMIKHKKME